MMTTSENGKPTNRRTYFTRSESLEILRDAKKNFKAAAEQICLELTEGADKTDFDPDEAEMARTIDRIAKKIRHLQVANQKKKFRHKKEMFENEPFIKADQYSVFNDDLEEMDVDFLDASSDEENESCIQQFLEKGVKKDGLSTNKALKKLRAKRNRFNSVRKMLSKLGAEVGATSAQLAGLIIHLEEYKENKSSAEIGLQIFEGQKDFNI